MPSQIQLAARAIDAEHLKGGLTEREAAINVVMRLQLAEERVLAMLNSALEREAMLTDNLRDALLHAD